MKAPHPIRTAKLSTVGPDQYFGRGLQGNLRCCMSFLFFFLQTTIFFFFTIFLFFSLFSKYDLTSASGLPSASAPFVTGARMAGVFGYIHEAEGRNKNLFFLIQALFELKKFRYLFLPSLCTTSPVAVFRFWVTSSICLKSKPPGLLFFFCFYTECQAFGLWMTCALVLELYGSMVLCNY